MSTDESCVGNCNPNNRFVLLESPEIGIGATETTIWNSWSVLIWSKTHIQSAAVSFITFIHWNLLAHSQRQQRICIMLQLFRALTLMFASPSRQFVIAALFRVMGEPINRNTDTIAPATRTHQARHSTMCWQLSHGECKINHQNEHALCMNYSIKMYTPFFSLCRWLFFFCVCAVCSVQSEAENDCNGVQYLQQKLFGPTWNEIKMPTFI